MTAADDNTEEYVPLTRDTYRADMLPADDSDPNFLRRYREARRITVDIFRDAGIDVSEMEKDIDTFDPRPGMAAAEAQAKEQAEIRAHKRATYYGYYTGEYYLNGKTFVRRSVKPQRPGDNGHPSPSVSAVDYAKAKMIAAQPFDQFADLTVGEVAGNIQFCHWNVAAEYPALFIGKINYVKAAYLFEGMLEGFVWDFFYLYHPVNHRQPAKLFVPTEQVVRFLDYVNATVGIKLTIPYGSPGEAFTVDFTNIEGHGPRYLGRTNQKADFEALLKTQPGWDEDDACEGASQAQIGDLIAKLRRCNVEDEKKREKEIAVIAREASAKQRRSDLQLVQHLLGLRPETRSYQDTQLPMDTTKPVPFKPFKDAVVASIDIEVAEEANSTIYEIGISILDTRDLANVGPGDGSDWFSLIKSHHLLTYEYLTCRNSKYVNGCPDMFNFGISELPDEADLAKRLLSILKKHVHPDGATENDWQLHRPLIVVGHGFKSDAGFLRSIGVDLNNEIYSHAAVIDTQHIDQVCHDLPQPRNLAALLSELEIKSTYLHNAGNDATYTMQALIAMAVRARTHELAEIAELEEELGADTGRITTPAQAPEQTAAVKNFVECLRKKRRPGEPSHEWRKRYHGF